MRFRKVAADRKVLLGMVHLKPLPGSPLHALTVEEIIDVIVTSRTPSANSSSVSNTKSSSPR